MDHGLLWFAADLVRDAGRLAAARFTAGRTAARHKDDGTEVTAVDVELERFLRARIAERFPDDAVVGEELPDRPGTSGRRWVLDPLNGTSLFLRRIPTFSIQLAVEDAAGPGIGVLGYPVVDEVLAAGRGLGCWHHVGDGEPRRAGVSATDRTARATVEALNPATWSEELLVALHREVFLLPWLKGALDVATGISDAAVIAGFPMGPEDLAPLPVLLGEAGGRVTDLSGADVLSGDGTALVTNGRLHPALLDLVAGLPHARDPGAPLPRRDGDPPRDRSQPPDGG